MAQQNFFIKTLHSLKVVEAIVEIGKGMNLSTEQLRLAQVIALLHDIGRFEQYQLYQTFSDHNSINHGQLGVSVLHKHGFLKNYSDYLQELICFAVGNHNAKELPEHPDQNFMLFAKLLRDADKLDIFRVVAEYYNEIKCGNDNKTVGLDLPNTEEISPKILKDFLEGRLVDMADLKSINDFKLLQLGWLFDINFPSTFKLIKKRKYIEMIISTLPNDGNIDKIREHASNYMANKSSIS
jgi:putative nucleotidyltransferase with HDIG domain